jgi:hypothetical protein
MKWRRGTARRRPASEEATPAAVDLDELEPGEGLRPIYFVLGATIVAAVAFVLLLPDHPMVNRFGANIATEAAAILVTLVFVHRFLQQQDRARRLRASIGALRRASRGLSRITDGWLALMRGTMPRITGERPRTLLPLFRPEATEGLTYLDPGALRSDPGGAQDTWIRWAVFEFSQSIGVLHDIIVAYGASLDPSYVEAVDELIDDPFLRLLGELAVLEPDTREWRSRVNAARTLREAHFQRLLRLVELHNALATQAGRVRGKWAAPKSGVLGFDLAPDHDLKVPVRISPEQWQAEPRPGALLAPDRRSQAPA